MNETRINDITREALLKARKLAVGSLTSLNHLNSRLQEIGGELKKLQPKTDGALLLAAYACGKGCMGCPHPRWEQWRHYPNNVKRTFIKHNLTGDPVRYLRYSGKFEKYYAERLTLIREAKKLIEQKSKLIKALSRLNRALGGPPGPEEAPAEAKPKLDSSPKQEANPKQEAKAPPETEPQG
jgi:hypothetical protein